MKKVFLIFLTVMLMPMLAACGNNNETPDGDVQNAPAESEGQASGECPVAEEELCVVKHGVTQVGEVVIIVENKSDDAKDVTAVVSSYDSNDALIGEQSNVIYGMAADSTRAIVIATEREYDTYEITLSGVEATGPVFSEDDFSISSNDTGEKMEVQAINHLDKTTGLNVIAVYYSEGEMLGYNFGYGFDVTPGDTVILEGIPYLYEDDANGDYVKRPFDSYEVFLVGADISWLVED